MFNMCKKQSKAELFACFAVGATVGAMGVMLMCGDKSMRAMKRKACRTAHRMTDFVVDNVKSLM